MKHISVCICTYRRAAMLERLLHSLGKISVDGEFEYSAVIVDNDADESARNVVAQAKRTIGMTIHYEVEPERSISLARNAAVRKSVGDLIAFIDDDELPDANWLLAHYRTLIASDADGALGPVMPDFGAHAPQWLIKSGLLDRKRFPTGTVVTDSRHLRTGNVLLWTRTFQDGQTGFDPKYGKIGGGDAAFFLAKITEGKKFIWCDEAVVYETVPAERQRLGYHVKRAFTRGMTTAWNKPFLSMSTLISLIAVPVYALALPISLFIGRHMSAKLLVKGCDHLAKILAYLGIRIANERPY